MSNKSTANKNVYGEHVDPEKARNFDLTTHLVGLMWEEPFYSRIIRSLNKKESTTIETAGVLCEGGELFFWWNRNFLASLSRNKIKGLLKHECLHLIYKHTTSRRREPHMVWNWATDLAINSQIPEKELPKGGLIPGKKLPKLSPEIRKTMSDDELRRHDHISNLIASLKPNKTSEYYYSILMNDEEFMGMIESNEKVFGIGMDDHEGWDSLNDDEREMLSQKIKEIVKSASEEADSKGWGSVSASLRTKVSRMTSSEVSWQSVLRRFCGFSNRQERKSTVTRLNRKYPLIHPGNNNDYKSTIAVYIDESGSVSNKELSKFYAELNSLAKHTKFWLYKFDTEVNEKDGFLWEQGKTLFPDRMQCGGTCFDAPTKHANKNKSKFDGYIIVTDGMAPKPENSRLKRGWVISSGMTLNFDTQKSDIVINLK